MLSVLKLARFQFVAGGFLVFLFGSALGLLAGAPFSMARLMIGYLVVFPAHLAVSFSNDYYDAAQDGAGTPAFFSGGSGVLVRQPHLKSTALTIAVLLSIISLSAGLFYIVLFRLPLWFFMLVAAGNLFGWVYSAPPVRLASRGLGEVAAGITVGVLVPMSGYAAAAGRIDLAWWPVWLVLFLYNTAFITAVSIPDEDADRFGGKNTWAVRFGTGFAYGIVGVLFAAAVPLFFFIERWVQNPAASALTPLAYPAFLPLVVWLSTTRRKPGSQAAHSNAVFWIITSLIVFLVLTITWMVILALQVITRG